MPVIDPLRVLVDEHVHRMPHLVGREQIKSELQRPQDRRAFGLPELPESKPLQPETHNDND